MKNTSSQAYADKTPWYIALMHYAVVAVLCLFFVLAVPTNAAVGVNLVQNPSLEQTDPDDSTAPVNWSKDQWGTNTTVFSYPTEGQEGDRSGKVQITTYKNGDAKWAFDHVPVVPGTTYQYSDRYKSDVTTEIVIEYKKTNNALSYISLGTVPVSTGDWGTTSKDFTVPAWIKSATVYHILKSIGSLTLDNVSLATGSGEPTIPPSPPASASGNLIPNASVETADNTSSSPLGWHTDFWGTNKALFTYPIAGQDRDKGVHVQVTSYKDGDAKWYFEHVPVTPGKTYTFSDYYRSNVPTTLTLEYKSSNGKLSYDDLGTAPATTTWSRYSGTFTVPQNVTAVTVLHHIDQVGYLDTDNFSLMLSSGWSGNETWTGSNGSGSGSGSTGTGSTGSGSNDTTGPNVSMISPTVSGGTFSGSVQISANASSDRGVAGVQFLLDGGALGSEISTAPYIFSWNTLTTSNGSHQIAARAKDLAGNVRTSAFIALNVFNSGSDNSAAPTVSLIEPIFNTTVSGSIQLKATATDDTGISKVAFFVDGNEFGIGTASWLLFSLPLDSTTLSNGQHSLYAEVWDVDGNTGSTTPINITVDNSTKPSQDTVPPTVSLTEPTTSGATYSGTIRFTATAKDDVKVSGVTFFVDDTAVGSGQISSGSTDSYELFFDSSKLTNATHSLSVKAYDAAGNTGSTASISITTNNAVSDTEAPKVSITSPKNGVTLSGSTTLFISATDNVGVTTVHYSITNGTDVIVGQLTTAPYTATIPVDALKSGSHTITVYAQDAAGNIGNATPVIYNTTYSAPTTSDQNLIVNPSLETGTGGIPDHWFQGGWGTNTATFKYPVPGSDGGNAAEVSISKWTDGDAKWFFADVPVSAGSVYTYSDKYKSTIPSTLTAQYTNSDGTVSFADIVSNLPPSTDWITATQTFTVPSNAVKVTVFHLIGNVGTLDIDNADLRLSSSGSTGSGTTSSGTTSSGGLDVNAFPTGLVSLTFDDGWGSQYDSAFPILNAAGIKGSFYIITDELKNAINENRIGNPSFETADSPSAPSGWTGSATGQNDALFTYPVTWVSGGKAAKVEINSYTSGDAKWQFEDTTVVDGEIHNFTDRYMATVPTKVTVVYTLNNGTTQTFDLGTVPASSTWSTASFTFTPPVNTKTLTIYHRLTTAGTLTTDDYHLDLAQDYMNLAQLKDIYNAGHELGAHTRTHAFLTQITPAQAIAEIDGSRQDMINAGFTPSSTFVYPYGDYNASVIQDTKNAGYIGARSVDQGYNTKATDKYALMIQEVNSSTTAEQWESWTQTAMKNHTWLILMFHQIDHQVDQYGATPEDLQAYVNYLKTNNIPTVTMEQGIKMMNP